MKRVLLFIPVLLLPALISAQTPETSSRATDIARAKRSTAMARRATRVRGEAVGLDNRPVTPATSAVRATPATPGTHDGTGPNRATPATPATPAVPASPSHRPDHAGQGGQGRGNNPRRP